MSLLAQHPRRLPGSGGSSGRQPGIQRGVQNHRKGHESGPPGPQRSRDLVSALLHYANVPDEVKKELSAFDRR